MRPPRNIPVSFAFSKQLKAKQINLFQPKPLSVNKDLDLVDQIGSVLDETSANTIRIPDTGASDALKTATNIGFDSVHKESAETTNGGSLANDKLNRLDADITLVQESPADKQGVPERELICEDDSHSACKTSDKKSSVTREIVSIKDFGFRLPEMKSIEIPEFIPGSKKTLGQDSQISYQKLPNLVKKVCDENTDLRAKLNGWSEKFSALKCDYDLLRTSFELKNEEIEKINEQMQLLRNEAHLYKVEIKKNIIYKEEIENYLKRIENEMTTIKANLEDSSKENIELKINKGDLEIKIKTLEAQGSKKEEEISTLEGKVNCLSDSIVSLTDEKDGLLKRINTMIQESEDIKRDHNEEVSRLTNEIKGLKDLLKDTKDSLERKNQEMLSELENRSQILIDEIKLESSKKMCELEEIVSLRESEITKLSDQNRKSMEVNAKVYEMMSNMKKFKDSMSLGSVKSSLFELGEAVRNISKLDERRKAIQISQICNIHDKLVKVRNNDVMNICNVIRELRDSIEKISMKYHDFKASETRKQEDINMEHHKEIEDLKSRFISKIKSCGVSGRKRKMFKTPKKVEPSDDDMWDVFK